MLSSMVQTLIPPTLVPSPEVLPDHPARVTRSSMDTFLDELRKAFQRPLHNSTLLSMSERIQRQFKDTLRASPISMLPSYIHSMPTGHERGTYVALDVGGSTLRVALVALEGRDKPINVVQMRSFEIGESVRALKGHAFFDWIAERVRRTLEEVESGLGQAEEPLSIGLTWAFPVEQTSIQSGLLLAMGKNFCANEGLMGQDVGKIVTNACIRKGNVKVGAIINDSVATLLAHAYNYPLTRISLILGTGLNAAVRLPVSALSPSKYGNRPKSWFDSASHVLVNTELRMFGKGIFYTTRWDDYLNRTHKCPDFQPMEMLVSGRYLGEIVRLILVEAIATVGLFGGEVPDEFTERYCFDTSTMAIIEADSTPDLSAASAVLKKRHPLPRGRPSYRDLVFVRQVCHLVSRRSAAYIAVGVHALFALRNNSRKTRTGEDHVNVSCNGSVIEKYPGFRTTCQGFLDQMTGRRDAIRLDMAYDSSILAAAVAVGCSGP